MAKLKLGLSCASEVTFSNILTMWQYSRVSTLVFGQSNLVLLPTYSSIADLAYCSILFGVLLYARPEYWVLVGLL